MYVPIPLIEPDRADPPLPVSELSDYDSDFLVEEDLQEYSEPETSDDDLYMETKDGLEEIESMCVQYLELYGDNKITQGMYNIHIFAISSIACSFCQ